MSKSPTSQIGDLEPLPPESIVAKACMDLSIAAQAGTLGPCLHRRKFIDRLVGYLAWEGKCKPLVLGRSGVGKTALLHGLARRLAGEDCPASLKGCRLLRTSMEDIYALASQSNEPFSRARYIFRHLFEQARENDYVILFDGMHRMIYYPVSTSVLRDELDNPKLRFLATSVTEQYFPLAQKYPFLKNSLVTLDLGEPDMSSVSSILLDRLDQAQCQVEGNKEDILGELVALTKSYLPSQQEPARSLLVLDQLMSRQLVEGGKGTKISLTAVRHAVADAARVPRQLLASRSHIFGMEAYLNHRVLGQEKAINTICRRLAVTKSGTSVTSHRPVGAFLFVGPTGVGKTELARAISEYLTGDPDCIIRLDMNSYYDYASVRTLLGAPGARRGLEDEEGGLPFLTKEVYDKPSAVLLLDEIEKACHEVRLLFLNAIDTGIMRDTLDNTLYLRHNTIIMTSNLGFSSRKAVVMHPALGDDGVAAEKASLALRAVQDAFPPEFLGRLDEIVVFEPLKPAIMKGFVNQKVALLEKNTGKKINLSADAMALIVEKGFSGELGARHLNRAIDSLLGYPLALLKASPGWDGARKVAVDVSGDGVGLSVSTETSKRKPKR